MFPRNVNLYHVKNKMIMAMMIFKDHIKKVEI